MTKKRNERMNIEIIEWKIEKRAANRDYWLKKRKEKQALRLLHEIKKRKEGGEDGLWNGKEKERKKLWDYWMKKEKKGKRTLIMKWNVMLEYFQDHINKTWTTFLSVNQHNWKRKKNKIIEVRKKEEKTKEMHTEINE